MRILITEQNEVSLSRLKQLMEFHKFTYDIAEKASDIEEYVNAFTYDIILLGSTDPFGTQQECITDLRKDDIHIPVLVISRDTNPKYLQSCFRAGADDYVMYPISEEEIYLRMIAIIRRSLGHGTNKVTVGMLTLDLDAKYVLYKDIPLQLTGKEFGILSLLMLRKGTSVSKERILESLYGGLDVPEMKIVDVFVCRIRQKIKDTTKKNDYIRTVWGRGYSVVDSK